MEKERFGAAMERLRKAAAREKGAHMACFVCRPAIVCSRYRILVERQEHRRPIVDGSGAEVKRRITQGGEVSNPIGRSLAANFGRLPHFSIRPVSLKLSFLVFSH